MRPVLATLWKVAAGGIILTDEVHRSRTPGGVHPSREHSSDQRLREGLLHRGNTVVARQPDAMRTDALRAMIRPLHRRNLRFREDSHWRAHSDLYLGLSTGSTSKAGCLGAMARIRSSLESGPVPSKKTPTSAFHFLR